MVIGEYKLPRTLDMTYVTELNKFRLLEPLYTPEVIVPVGFVTDGASVPRIFQNLVPSYHRYLLACVVHDYMCENRDAFPVSEIRRVFKLNLKRSGVSQVYRNVLYYATKWFGPGTIFIK